MACLCEHGTVSPQGTVIQFPLTHEDLSFLTGVHRVSITRAMKALKAAGKIVHEDRRLILPALKTAYLGTALTLSLYGCGGQTIPQKPFISSELPLPQTLQTTLDKAREKTTVIGASASVMVADQPIWIGVIGSAPSDYTIANNWSSAGFVDLAPKPQPWTTTSAIHVSIEDWARFILLHVDLQEASKVNLTEESLMKLHAQPDSSMWRKGAEERGYGIPSIWVSKNGKI